eukprot:TRINITY_DN7995_c0_g1_i1.p1 TRINITY_DN7995_c0_g1~~TRINITY_DN7995_c0_g1_i1.p1  ORF type:complete len:189 (-),score=9.73 TRINITY_DN7995_c0_g1_i1:257-823(-)
MHLSLVLSPLFLFTQTVVSKPWVPWSHDSPPIPLNCLTVAQALDIATRYLSCYNSGAVKTLYDLAGIISPNFTSYDETGTGPYSDGPATVGIDAFFQSLTASGPSAFGNAVQYPLFVLHDCTRISYRWKFEGWSTGYNATVPAGTYLEFKGTDIISVDLDTMLVFNATSSGDWINLARELGQIGNFFP